MTTRERIKHYFRSEEMGWPRLVSDILSPPVVWGLLALPIAFRDAPSRGQALLWAAVYITIVCIVPIVYIATRVRQGKITDIHMKLREQRMRPLLVSLACTAVAWWTLRFMGAPPVVPLLAISSFIQLALITLITTVWQISLHAMSITGAAITSAMLFGALPALLLTPLVVLVAVARMKLKRHTFGQIMGGAALGLIVPFVLITAVAG